MTIIPSVGPPRRSGSQECRSTELANPTTGELLFSHTRPSGTVYTLVIQTLEEQLQQRDAEFMELETSLQDVKRKSQKDKEALKRAARYTRVWCPSLVDPLHW